MVIQLRLQTTAILCLAALQPGATYIDKAAAHWQQEMIPQSNTIDF
jgi:hypothetical protein